MAMQKAVTWARELMEMLLEALVAVGYSLAGAEEVERAGRSGPVAPGLMEIPGAVAVEVETAAVQQVLPQVVIAELVPTAAIIKGGQDMVLAILPAAGRQPARTVVVGVGVGVTIQEQTLQRVQTAVQVPSGVRMVQAEEEAVEVAIMVVVQRRMAAMAPHMAEAVAVAEH